VWPAGFRGRVRTPGRTRDRLQHLHSRLDETDATVPARRPPSILLPGQLDPASVHRRSDELSATVHQRLRDEMTRVARPLRRGHGPPASTRASAGRHGVPDRANRRAARGGQRQGQGSRGTPSTPASARCRVPSRTASTRSTAASTRDLTATSSPGPARLPARSERRITSSSTVRWPTSPRSCSWAANRKGRVRARVVARRPRKVTRTRTDFVPVDQVYGRSSFSPSGNR